MSAFLFACLYVYDIFKKYGRPKFSTDYAMQIIPDQATMKVFLGVFIALSNKPYIFAVAPVFFSEIAAFIPTILAVSCVGFL
jgi:hypothetical protein